MQIETENVQEAGNEGIPPKRTLHYQLYLCIKALRPLQWTKNLSVFAALFFSKNLFNQNALLKVCLAFVIFCLLSGSYYIFNDIFDRETDKEHPEKSKRPIASGKLGIGTAIVVMVLCAFISLTGAYFLGTPFFIVCLSSLFLQILYSLILKKIVIVDAFAIAVAFVLRVAAGGFAINVEISSWILICTLLLALFLALGKRRHELQLFGQGIASQRRVLAEYNGELLSHMISIVGASTVITYALYTVSESTREKFHTQNLIFTIPFVLYGIFRYLYLIHRKQQGGSPETILVTDKPLYINILLWLLTAGVILYVK
jgi:4-hydroxybenzoate polyprenyltransferase